MAIKTIFSRSKNSIFVKTHIPILGPFWLHLTFFPIFRPVPNYGFVYIKFVFNWFSDKHRKTGFLKPVNRTILKQMCLAISSAGFGFLSEKICILLLSRVLLCPLLNRFFATLSMHYIVAPRIDISLYTTQLSFFFGLAIVFLTCKYFLNNNRSNNALTMELQQPRLLNST